MVIVFSEKGKMVDSIQLVNFLPKCFVEVALCEVAILQNNHAVKSGSIVRDKFRRGIWVWLQHKEIVNSKMHKGYF